jgi:two-component system, LuxR family, response regulator FixJ
MHGRSFGKRFEAPSLKPSILILDDDHAARDSLRMLMEAYGYRVKVFGTVQAFQQERLDADCCLILDVHLDGVSGLEILAQIRGRGLVVPAVLVSGLTTRAMLDSAARLGALALLEKPINVDVLLAAIISIDDSGAGSER